MNERARGYSARTRGHAELRQHARTSQTRTHARGQAARTYSENTDTRNKMKRKQNKTKTKTKTIKEHWRARTWAVSTHTLACRACLDNTHVHHTYVHTHAD